MYIFKIKYSKNCYKQRMRLIFHPLNVMGLSNRSLEMDFPLSFSKCLTIDTISLSFLAVINGGVPMTSL